MKTRIVKVTRLIICLVAFGLVAYSSKPSPTSEMAIRKYVLLKGILFEVRNLEISSTTIEDNNYGHGLSSIAIRIKFVWLCVPTIRRALTSIFL